MRRSTGSTAKHSGEQLATDVVAAQFEGARVPSGLRLYPQFVSRQTHDEILGSIRRDIHWTRPDAHGNRAESYLRDERPMPGWAADLASRMVAEGVFPERPDCLQLTRYDLGGGMLPHLDRTDVIGPIVAAMAIGSSRVVQFTRVGRRSVRLLVFPGDLYVMAGASRYRWKHEVPFARVDSFCGEEYVRSEGIAAVWCQFTGAR